MNTELPEHRACRQPDVVVPESTFGPVEIVEVDRPYVLAGDDLMIEEDAPWLPSMGKVRYKVKCFTDEQLAKHDAAVEARVRAQVAAEIARKIEARKPSSKTFWSATDAAYVYAYNNAAKIARKHGAIDTPTSGT